jgi:hypothetical protein
MQRTVRFTRDLERKAHRQKQQNINYTLYNDTKLLATPLA